MALRHHGGGDRYRFRSGDARGVAGAPMKVSEWLRLYQLGNGVPEGDSDPMLPFWCGWMCASGGREVATSSDERLEMAIKAAEFIEGKAK